MVRYIVKRLFALIPVILVLTFIVFTILSMTPGDATAIILGSEYTPELGAKLREQLGLDRPGIRVIDSEPSLEDVFVTLSRQQGMGAA